MPATRPPCLVCKEVEGKYKCPRCNAYTCCVACSREHRDNHPPMEEDTEASSQTRPVTASVSVPLDTSPPQQEAEPGSFKMSNIADMPEYHELVKKYPRLEAQLWGIALATDPPSTNESGNNAKHSGLPGLNHRKSNQPWDKEIGLENGRKTLHQLTITPSDDREAIREFCELVHLFRERKQSAEAEAELRRQLAQDDLKTIGRLIRAEKSLGP
ncbi:hypothetical protein F5X99DRAFT_44203 [Biscogniauxia marginata]|nr:hypothetical protein F5X99DRAFT_44203 [Biscogniauxia marginata]